MLFELVCRGGVDAEPFGGTPQQERIPDRLRGCEQ
jgi:hypothetical protein